MDSSDASFCIDFKLPKLFLLDFTGFHCVVHGWLVDFVRVASTSFSGDIFSTKPYQFYCFFYLAGQSMDSSFFSACHSASISF